MASRRGRVGRQRRDRALERHRRGRLSPAMVLVKPLHSLTFALLHLVRKQLSVVVPPALAATAQGIYGGRRPRHDDRHHDTGIRSTLRRSRPTRVLGHGAASCRCVADRVRDAQGIDQSVGVKSDLVGASIAA
jgi:hypothetical protein